MHIQAFQIAERVSLPVMVCMDGFILTHAYEEVDIPDQEAVDQFVPSFEPRQVLDPAEPVTIGAMVGREAFFEVKYLAHAKQMEALDVIPEVAQRFAGFGRPVRRPRAPLPDRGRRDDHRRARLGSRDDRVRGRRAARGRRQGRRPRHQIVRPFPLEEVREALTGAYRVVVLEKALAVGRGGIVSTDVHEALHGTHVRCNTVVAGLGGRSITRESLRDLFERAGPRRARAARFPRPEDRSGRARAGAGARGTPSGPHEQNILNDIGVVAAGPH